MTPHTKQVKMRNIWKTIAIILTIILATPLINAADWDNVLDYENEDLTVKITNWFGLFGWLGLDDEIGTAELKSHKSVDYIKEVGIGNQIVMWYDFNFAELYLNGLGEVEFTNMKTGKEIERDYSFVYWGEKERDVYGQGKCFININGTQTCESIVVGKETYETWLPYNSKDIPKGNIRIGLMTYVEIDDEVDGVWTIVGKKINKHAVWFATAIKYTGFENGAINRTESTGITWVWFADGVYRTTRQAYISTTTVFNGTYSMYVNSTYGKGGVINRTLDEGAFTDNTFSFWMNTNKTGDSGYTEMWAGTNKNGTYIVYALQQLSDCSNGRICTYDSGWTESPHNYIANTWVRQIIIVNSTGTYFFFNNESTQIDYIAGVTSIGTYSLQSKYGYFDDIAISPGSDFDCGIGKRAGLDITLLLPEDTANFTTSIINFSANVSDSSLVGIQNVSLLINESIVETNTSGFEGFYNFSKIIPDGNHNWTVIAYDDADDLAVTVTWDFTIDTVFPIINIISPEGGIYHKSGNNLTLNWTVIDLNLDTCWFNYNSTNTTVTCANNITTFALTSQENLTFYANDTFGHLTSNFITWFYHSWEYERTFNNITYETANETYNIKINTIDSITPTSPKFFHNDVEYTATTTPLGGNNFSISKTIDVQTISSEVNKTFYFQWDVDVNEATSETSNQTIKTISFVRCFSGTPFLNFTFKDEADDSVLNASNDLTDADYWLGSGAITKSYITSNTTDDYGYMFCFLPLDRTVITDLIFKYSKTGYPLRTFTYDDQSLTNTTLDKTLYLLSTTDGIYSSISVIESSGASIEGVVIQIERQFGGIWTLISQDTTGSDGVATFWVNPNFQHRITATKTNYVTTQVTITPSQTLYTLTMQRTTGEAVYESDIPGLVYTSRPAVGPTVPGARNFNITIWSSEENLENCKFELINASNTSQVFDSDTSITNSSYCFININYNLEENTVMFGRLSVDTTETTGFVIIDTDLKWIGLAIDVKEWRTIKSFFADLITLSEFGEGEEAEFSRIITFFLIATIIFGVIIYFSGVELTSPGIAIILIWGIVLFASAGGFLTVDLGSPNVNTFIEQYAFSFLFTITMINYFLTTIRRAEE